MPSSDSSLQLEAFQTFGDLLKHLRRRARLTQRELSIAVKYSEAQISRLEQNQRPPDLAALTALFIPALYLEEEPETVARLMELATEARGEKPSYNGTAVTFSQSVQHETKEHVRIVEENVQLGEETFEAAWNQGRFMKLQEAIDYALKTSQD